MIDMCCYFVLQDVFGSERRKAKMLNFSIAYGKTAMGLAKDWKVDLCDLFFQVLFLCHNAVSVFE